MNSDTQIGGLLATPEQDGLTSLIIPGADDSRATGGLLSGSPLVQPLGGGPAGSSAQDTQPEALYPSLPFPDAPSSTRQPDADEERQKRLELFLQIPLYDEDASVRKAVDDSPEFRIYGGAQKTLRSPGAYHIYGKDLARLVAPDMLNNPLELVQRTIAGVDDEVERSSWQKELDALMTSGKDDARSYWGLFGKMTWQKVQGEYARYRDEQRRQQELYDENQYRVNSLVQRAIGGFEVEPTPEDMQLIREAGVDWQEVDACSKAMRLLGYPYGIRGFDAAITAETARKVYGVIKDHPQARQLLMQQLAEIGRHNDAGAVASLLEGVLSFGENVKETLNHYDLAEVLPQSEGTLRDSLHQKGLEAVAAFLDDHPEMRSNEALCNEIYMGPFRQYEENSAVAALWGEMKNAVETGRAENVDVLGQTMRDVGSGAAFMLRLMPFVRGLNLLAGPAGERQRVALKAYEANMDMADPAIGAQAGAYGLIDAAALLRAPAAVYGALGRATLNTGLGARYTLFAARPAGALAVNAARGTLDAAVIIPGAMGGLKALYDASPLVADERLNTGMEELASLQAQLSDPKYLVSMAANGILFSGVGVRHVRGRAAQGLQRYADYRVMRMNGLTERQCADIAKLPAQERMQAMEQAVRDNVQSDPEANLRRSIDACRAELNRRQAQEMRADNAVQAALEARGYSLRESEQEGKVWMYTDGRMNPDGSFSPGEKKVLMTQEDADVFVQVIMRRELEATASAMRKEAGKMRLLDAFTGNLKGNARVRIMPRPETLEGLNRKAAQADERAVARSRELMSENEGMSEAEARARALDEVHPDIDDRPLGEVIQTAHDLGARLELERARGGSGDGTRAYVTTRRRPDGQVAERVLRIALDDRRLTMHEVAEELGEQIAKDWMESNGMDYADAYRTLRELQQTMEAHPDKDVRDSAGRFLSLKRLNEALEARLMGERKESASDLTPEEEAQVRSEVVEAISKLMRSDLISSASDMQGEFPAWARELFDTTTLTMAELPQQVAMAHALATARAEGWMPEAARTLLGVAPKAVEDALRRQAEPTVEEYRRDWFNKQRRQAELDAAFGEGVLRDPAETERFEQGCVDGQEAREQARASEQDAGFAEAREHVNELEKESPGMSHEEAVKTAAEKAADAKETEIEADPAAQQDAAFSGGRYVEIPDEGGHAVKAGMLPVDKLEVLPNFKLGADPQTGVVHPLTGDYYSTHDPIRAMRMKDGRIVVFSGRHRLDACRRAGVSRIMAYLYEEAADRGEAWMRRYDIESNIRDNQASPLEVALYVRGEFTEGRALSDEEAARAGIDRTGSLGAMGYRIGRNAGSSVIDALRNGRIDDRTALWIADFCPGNDAVQRRGLERAMDGASKGEILARMEAELALKSMQNELGIEGTTDLFGNAIDNDGFMDFVAQYVNRKRNELSKDIAYLRTNAGKRNSQAMAEKYGIKVGDAEGLKRQLTEMQALQDRWKNPYTDEALMGEIREAWRAENEGQQIAASRKEPQSLSVLDSYFASIKGVKTESEFSTFDRMTKPEIVERWRDEVDTFFRDSPIYLDVNGKPLPGKEGIANAFKSKDMEVCPTPAVLRMVGVKPLDIVITRSEMHKVTVRKHHISRDELIKLPEMLSDPVCVLQSDTPGCVEVVTEMKENGVNVLVAIQLNTGGTRTPNAKVNRIASLYGKENIRATLTHPRLYWNKAKARVWVGNPRLQLPRTTLPNRASGRKVLKPEDLVKYKNQYELDFSIAGMKARCASEYIGRGEDYIDKADGQRKFVIPNTEARLSTGFTMGQLNPPEGGHKDVSLPALLHHPELYRNYPELAEMRVRLYNPTVDDSCYGFFHPKTDDSAAFIALNMKHCKGDAAQVLSTLLHESQHAIQTMEGFSVGAGVFDRGLALRYLDRAMELRKKLGVRDEWSQMNMRYMKFLHKLVSVGDKEALMAVYYHSRGEQEARFTGDGKGEAGENPTIGGKLTDGLPDSTTIAVTRDATELGGVTFLNMGRFGHLLDSRLNPGGEFNYDRAIYQMKENVIRRMRELKGLAEPGEAEGLRLAAEGLATMDSIEALLPNTYRYALEPYKLYFNTFAKLRGTGDAAAAASTVPMKGWDVRMYKAFRNSVWRLITETNEPLGEFWEHAFSEIPRAREGLEGMREYWLEVSEVVKAEYAERLADAPTAKERRRVRAKMMEEAHTRVELAYGEEMMKLYQALGSMRADKLMAKFLERVALQLDNFRKDKTLGRIRRVVDSLSPAPGKDGKPVKGRMDADSYRRVMDFVKLLELTRGERDRFFRTRYTGEEGTGEKAWAELEPNDKISVEVFDEDGKPMMLTCSKGEFEAYACYDAMTAAQAEAASRALGEFISTGKQAWENAEEAAKQRIAARCAPLMEAYDESINEYDERQNKRQRGVFSGGRKMLELLGWTMNDVQFFDALTGVPEIAAWAREFSDRIASAHVYMESNEKLRQGFLLGVLAKAAGTDKPKKVRAFLDEINRTQDTGVRLVPREPDFLGQEMATVRRQFLGLLHRKTHEKNFRPNNFAEALRTLTEKGHEIIPEDIAKEALAKYGTLGDAKKAVLKGEQAVMSLLTERERERFSNLTKTARSRAKEAREKWQESDKGVRVEQGVSDAESGETRRMSRAQAAYHVLMTEQADYAEMLRQQGYDEAAVAKLREFAGEDVMQLAYDLRDELGARTEQVKDMYERVYGMPFPEVENYFRAFFDVGYEQKENTVLDNQGYGSAAGGGAAKILYTRQHHNQSIDPTMNVLNAFALAMKQQDVLLGYGELPSDVMRVLNYKEDNHRSMAHALSLKIGDHALREMREHAINMTRLIPETEAVAGKLAIALNRLSSASAVTILNYRMGSLMKQGTALFNSFAGSDMVTAWEWDKSAARVTAGLGKISLKEMAARPELASRFKGWAAGADAAAQRALRDVKVSHGATDAKILGGMTLMEWVDVRANVRSSAILYDAVYRKLEKASPDMTPAQLDEAAMTEVRRALALKSQPLDWRSRSLMATKRSVFKMGSLFLGGESINTFGNVARLLARGKRGDWRRAAGVWIRHGVALQALTFLYNFLTDDEDMWERRSAYGYLTGSLLGPLMGIPFVSQVVSGAIGGVNHFLPKEYRAWMPTGSMLPMGDIERTLRDWKKWDKGSWQDRGIIVENTIRALAGIGAAIFSEPTTAGGARVKAASYATAAASNLIDFLLRGSRAVDERL